MLEKIKTNQHQELKKSCSTTIYMINNDIV